MIRVMLCSSFVSLLVAGSSPAQGIPFRPAPARVPGIGASPASDRSPSVTYDKRQLVFASDRAGGAGNFDLWEARRADPGSAWTAPRPVAGIGLNTPANETAPALNPIGSRLLFVSDRPGGLGAGDLWAAARPDDRSGFGTPVPVVELNSRFVEDEPALVADELEVFFVSDRPGGPLGGGIWRASRTSVDGRWQAPQPVRELDGRGREAAPSLSRDGLTIWFTSDRGTAGMDVWVASRANRSARFGAPVRVSELSTAAPESGLHVCYDDWTIFLTREIAGSSQIFASDRDGPMLEALAEPALNDPWQVWVRADPGSLAVVLASGGSIPPVKFPGIGGAFELDPSSLFVLHIGVCDRFEMSVAQLQLPASTALEGVDLHLQAFAQRPTEGWFRRFSKRWRRRIRRIYAKWNLCKDTRNRCITACRASVPKMVERCARQNLYRMYWGPRAYAQSVYSCAKGKLTACIRRCLFEYTRCMLR